MKATFLREFSNRLVGAAGPGGVLCLPLLASLGGCVIGNNKFPKPEDLAPAWLVDRPRILAIVADPPEVAPGATASFAALVGRAPEAESDELVLWLACATEGDGVGFGCPLDLEGLDFENPDPEALAAAGVIGVEPFLKPSYVPPTSLLDGLEGRDRTEGVYVNVQIAVIPPESLEDPDNFDFNEVEVGYKRLVVSEALTPNHNPGVEGFAVDGLILPPDTVAYVDAGESYELSLVLSDDAIETYSYLNRDGETESRVEEPYIAWFSTGGDVEESVTLYPYLESTWSAPTEGATEGTWWAVLRDRRGGMAWFEQRWAVISP